MSTLGVVIPTRNSMTLLPRHLISLRQWLEVADEVVVVDSFSEDGTFDCLKRELQHPRLSFFQQPPGLYQSWNFAIQQLQTEFAYISTVGDSITRDGILRLVEVAKETKAGIVISKPDFLEEHGGESPDVFWPLDDILQRQSVTKARALDPLEVIAFTASNLGTALSGSCASNLFRTSVLKQFPFPVDYGKGGDGAWSALHVADVTWAVVPEKFSTFLWHADTAPAKAAPSGQEPRRIELLFSDALRKSSLGVDGLADATVKFMEGKAAFDKLRKLSFPWYLSPAAWATRNRRNVARRACLLEREEILAKVSE